MDIVEELKAMSKEEYGDLPGYARDTTKEAADEIERLREALADLIADLMKEPEVARDVIKALKGKS